MKESPSSLPADPRPIGIFDSGIGGLTVVAAVRRVLPQENIIYLGDNARVPYGNRSPETIRKFALQDLDFLRSRGVKAVLAACNTVSSVALDVMCKHAPGLPVFGMILPGVEAALAAGKRKIAVIGTRGTINSGSYRRALLERNPDLEIRSLACPLLVPLAEEGITCGPLVNQVFDLYFDSWRKSPPDVLLLGCTHYPLFQQALSEYFPHTQIIDSAGVCAQSLKQCLIRENIAADPGTCGFLQINVTDASSVVENHIRFFLGTAFENGVHKVTL